MENVKQGAARTLGSRLEKAKTGAATLSQATDELNKKLDVVEAALVALNLGVSTSIVISGSVVGGYSVGNEIRLSFQKVDQEWGLYIKLPDQTVRIQSVSRSYRVLACDKLADLVSALIDRVDEEVAAVRKGASRVDALLADLAGGVKP